MINKNILYAILKASTISNKDVVLEELLTHISNNYDCDNKKADRIIGMLMGTEKPVTIDRFNKDYIENNLNHLLWNYDKYNIKDIKATSVDNIDCTIRIEFAYLDKRNEDSNDVSYSKAYQDVSFIDNPEILKKIK